MRAFHGFRTVSAFALLCFATVSSTLQAAPLMENATPSTVEEEMLEIWVDNYVVSSSEPLDYTTMNIVSGPSHGTIDIDDEYGVFLYWPDEDYSGFDSFSYTVNDELNNQSNEVWVFISIWPAAAYHNLVPSITGFHAENLGGGYWRFAGYVQDEDTSAGTLSFGGLLSGQTASIGTNGYFSVTVSLSSPGSGNVYVNFVDEFSVGAEASIIGFSY